MAAYRLTQSNTLYNFVSSSVLVSIIGLLSGFISYRFIEPQLIGLWATIAVFEVYATIIRFGIPNGMCRELPYELGKGNIAYANSLASTTLAYSIFSSFIALLILPLVFLVPYFNISGKDQLICIGVLIIRVLIEPYTSYLSGTFRTNDQFDKLSRIQYIQATIRLASITFIILWGFYGFLLRETIIPLSNSIQLHLARPFKLRPKFNWIAFKRLFSIGFPIFIISYATLAIDTFPRLFLINYGDAYQLGIFSPVIILIGTAKLIPGTISGYLYPKLAYSWGQDADLLKLWNKTKRIFLTSLIVSLTISLLVFFGIDYIIKVLPKYVASVPYIKIGCFTILFIAFQLGNTLLVVLKKWKYLIIFTVAYAIIQISSLFVLRIYFSDNLLIASLSQVITFSVMFLISFFFAYRSTHVNTSLTFFQPIIQNGRDNIF